MAKRPGASASVVSMNTMARPGTFSFVRGNISLIVSARPGTSAMAVISHIDASRTMMSMSSVRSPNLLLPRSIS